jgi:hypothetical protein
MEEGDEEMHSHHSYNESFRKMEGREILNEKRKRCVKLWDLLCVLFILFSFIFALLTFLNDGSSL